MSQLGDTRLTYVDVLYGLRQWVHDRQADKCPRQLSFHRRHRDVGARGALQVLHLFIRERVIENVDATMGGTGVVRWDRREGRHWCEEGRDRQDQVMEIDRLREIEREREREREREGERENE